MTKNDLKRLRGLLNVAAGSIAAVKGDFKNPERMNIERMCCMVAHWQESGQEIREILAMEKIMQPDLFANAHPITLDLDNPDALVAERVVHTNGREPGEEVGEEYSM